MAPPTLDNPCCERLRLGIVGLGKMGMLHLKTWQAIPLVDITAIVDTDPAKGILAQMQGIPFFRRSEEIIGKVDLAIIATPGNQHFMGAEPLLTAGIHCLFEKPLAMNFAETKQLVSTAARHHAILVVGHSERFNAGVRHIRETLGPEIRRVEVFRMAAMASSRDMSTDVVQDLMLHDLDWVINAFRQTPCHVDVVESRRMGNSLSYVSCELGFADGRQACITASRMEAEGRREVVLHASCGKKETISLNTRSGQSASDPLKLQAFAFLDALHVNVSMIATGLDAMSVMNLGDQIRARCGIMDGVAS